MQKILQVGTYLFALHLSATPSDNRPQIID